MPVSGVFGRNGTCLQFFAKLRMLLFLGTRMSLTRWSEVETKETVLVAFPYSPSVVSYALCTFLHMRIAKSSGGHLTIVTFP